VNVATNSSGSGRRPLPSSPFQRPTPPPPVETFSVEDRVTHDTYGLGSVVAIEGGDAVIVDFGSRQERVSAPYRKLTKL
jgi:hypothetical protein